MLHGFGNDIANGQSAKHFRQQRSPTTPALNTPSPGSKITKPHLKKSYGEQKSLQRGAPRNLEHLGVEANDTHWTTSLPFTD